MKSNYSRREFLITSTALAAGLGFGLGAVTAHGQESAPAFKTKLHKALIVGKPTEDEARKAALESCRSAKSGSDEAQSACVVVGTFQNHECKPPRTVTAEHAQ